MKGSGQSSIPFLFQRKGIFLWKKVFLGHRRQGAGINVKGEKQVALFNQELGIPDAFLPILS